VAGHDCSLPVATLWLLEVPKVPKQLRYLRAYVQDFHPLRMYRTTPHVACRLFHSAGTDPYSSAAATFGPTSCTTAQTCPHAGAAMQSKRRWTDVIGADIASSIAADNEDESRRPSASKRVRQADPWSVRDGRDIAPHTNVDRISHLSDELLIRILSFLPLSQLLAVSLVSHRFGHLAADSHLWRELYYHRFVLPRALRIPGFRDGGGAGRGSGDKNRRLHEGRRQTLWTAGGRGSIPGDTRTKSRRVKDKNVDGAGVDWRRQYKIRHNWARGACAVEELRLGIDGPSRTAADGGKILVKVIEGTAVTADAVHGLRIWDLKSKSSLAQIRLGPDSGEGPLPTCICLDDQHAGNSWLDIVVGFEDGGFGIWRFDATAKTLHHRYNQGQSSNGDLMAVAFSHPYLLTATSSVLVSLYTFEQPLKAGNQTTPGSVTNDGVNPAGRQRGSIAGPWQEMDHSTMSAERSQDKIHELPAPCLMTSLKSHSSSPPLVLNIRKLASTTIASIAYTFSTRQGWSIGVQDLHIRGSMSTAEEAAPEISTTQLAYTPPVKSGSSGRTPPQSPRRNGDVSRFGPSPCSNDDGAATAPCSSFEAGPTALCYNHPYLLATLPDNTLVLHLCTSSSSELSLSPGIRLWGHTSGISNADITCRGKAVSVSSRGQEMRVWELEGRGERFSGRSVQVRPLSAEEAQETERGNPDWDERRNWVGFDDEMVIVLKEAGDGRESLMVYDFT